jgi:hypothetical protein
MERSNGSRRRPCCRRFKSFRIYLKILASSNSSKIRDVQEASYPFTGGIIPVYRIDYTRLQGSPSPIIPIYRKHLSACNLKSYWEIHAFYRAHHTRLQEASYPFTGQSYLFTGCRDNLQKNKGLLHHTRLQEKASPDHTRNELTYGYDSYTLSASDQTE